MDPFDRLKTLWKVAKSGTDSLMSKLSGSHDNTRIFEHYCDFCKLEGCVKEAIGYCSDCRDYLCAECFSTHRRPKPSRHHQLLDQHQMPKDKQRNRGTESRSWLKGGSDNMYEYYCGLCKGKAKTKEAVEYCSTCLEYMCTDCYYHHKRSGPMRHHVLLDLHQIPKDRQTLTSSQKVTADVEARVSFQQNIGVRRTCAHHVMDVRVRPGDPSNTPNISGCVVLPGDKLVILDSYNSNVRLADLNQCDVVSQLDLPGNIWDIAQVGTTQVAVTSHNKQTIYFVNAGHDMKLDRKIKVNGQCRGIARISDNLIVVSYDCPVKVEIISMKGILLQTVVSEDDSRNLFSLPWYIAVTKDQQTIYISDAGTHSVTSVDLAGRVQATYRDDKLRGTLGLTVGTAGIVYVCGNVSNNILQLTADLNEGRELLKECDDVRLPASVCYCEATDKLCIGTYEYDKVKVFQLE